MFNHATDVPSRPYTTDLLLLARRSPPNSEMATHSPSARQFVSDEVFRRVELPTSPPSRVEQLKAHGCQLFPEFPIQPLIGDNDTHSRQLSDLTVGDGLELAVISDDHHTLGV